LMYYL